ncbi:hypothetical protein AJ78_06342 [Emergomyces pasteurianus Ep9510]|uniref:Conidiation-specific protein 13 n=1 Tax=Emergomyces pasteurianus Ep9510 TaxID=1447872 RepID=A0A1J9QB88_9EURO|nr:hypothetical protein AJ78_06342 [Emergomyces pasteurianus Ep9510]
MGVLTSLCQFTLLLGLANAQIVKPPLIKTVRDLDARFDAALPAPQKYTYSKLSAAEIARGIPNPFPWGASLYEPTSEYYCKDDFSVYNVTFPDCPEPWLVGHCARAAKNREETFNLLGRLPSSARGGVSDLLNMAFPPNLSIRVAWDNSAIFGGGFRPADGVKMILTALIRGAPGIPMDDFMKAVEADSCVADQDASEELKRGGYFYAQEGGLAIAAYMKLVKTPPIDASCMSNQLKILRPILDKRWDAPGQCPNKIAPKLVKYKPILFPRGIEVLNVDPVPGPGDATVVLWDKSDGIPEWFWHEGRVKRQNDPSRIYCEHENIQVFNVSYPDCDQDPWTLGRCTDAQESVDDIVRKFGRLPAGLRSYITHLIAFENPYPAGGGLIPLNYVTIYGDVVDSVYMHEAAHHVDRGFFQNATFLAAKAADTCYPTTSSKLGDRELLADLGVTYLYDKSGKTLLERGYDASCLVHLLNALGDYAGGDFQRTSKCFKRPQNSRVIHPTDAEFANPEPYISQVVMEHFPNKLAESWDWRQEINLHRG